MVKTVPSPAYGSGLTLAIYGLLVAFVDLSGPSLVALLTTAEPGLAAAQVTGGMAVGLWVGLGLVIAYEGSRQYRALLPAPVDPGEFEASLDARRPSPTAWGVSATGLLVGGVILLAGHGTAVSTLEAIQQADRTGMLAGVTGADLGITATVLVAYLGAAWGFDRVVVGALREFQYRRVGDGEGGSERGTE